MIKHTGCLQPWRSFSFFISTVLTAILLFSLPAFAGENADMHITGTTLSVTGKPSITFIQLRVVDPAGQVVCDVNHEGSSLAWSLPAGAADGRYSYEVTLGREPKKGKSEENNSRGLGPKIRAMIESGSFLVKDGVIVPATGEETGMLDTILSTGGYALQLVMDFLVAPAAADQVIADDLVVQSSACVGMDCANGESFGFDTLRLKENNLRIKFDDTSASAGFPYVDWQLTANDSINGGENKFSLEDITNGQIPFTIRANAPNHSLYVDSYGRIGLGTSTPVMEIHVKDSDTPSMRLEQDSSGGWTPQSWDVAGNESNFFIRDVTNSGKLPFRIQPGTPSNTLNLKSDGNVGMGTWSPTASLHILESDTGQATLVRVATTTADIFTVAASGDAYLRGNLELGSSRSIKQNIHAVTGEEAMAALVKLEPVHFQYRSSPDVNSVGFIAEDVPDIVATEGRKSVRPMDIVAVLTRVVQEQQQSIEQLQATITGLQEKMEADRRSEERVTLR
ncbi:MAG: tail fiber domain-containing protein [Pseudomonadota bacterium]